MSALFYSETPCFLKQNGNIILNINKNLTFLNDITENDFLEFIPKSNLYLPTYFYKNYATLVKTFNVLGDVLYIPLFEKKRNLPYKLLYQKKFNVYNGYLLITVIQDGFYKLYIDGIITHIEELPFLVTNVTVTPLDNVLFIELAGEKTLLFAFDANGNLLFKDAVTKYSISNFLVITTFYNLILPCEITRTYDLTTFTLINTQTKLAKSRYDVAPELLNSAFFEIVSIGGDFSSFLSPNLTPRINDLKSFIKSPIVIMPYYKDLTKTLAIYNNKVSIYKLEKESGLITNVIEEDI